MTQTRPTIPYGKTVHGEAEIAAVAEVLRTSTQMGKNVREFERRVAALFAKPYGIMVNSGSSANFLAVALLQLPKGSEVITPVLTFATTIAPLVQHGLRPALVDVMPGTYNIAVDQIEALIGPKTRALMIPNLIGNVPDWDRLRQIADRHDLALIEDSADTLGATLRGRSTGERADISTASFYGSHVINAAGNGGMLCVGREVLANRAKLLRSWGRESSLFVDSENIATRFNVELDGIRYDAKFVFAELGYNFEPSELGAAFGLVQLGKLADNIALRERWLAAHSQFFRAYEAWFLLPQQQPESRTAWLAYALTVRDEAPFSRSDLQIHFENHGIQTRPVFTGNVLRQPGFKGIAARRARAGYPVADQVMRGGILFACHHGLEQADVERIHEVFREFVKRF